MQGNIARCELSSAQLETVIYANQRFQAPRLPDGSRPGFFLGDGAGVGKGVLPAPCFPAVTDALCVSVLFVHHLYKQAITMHLVLIIAKDLTYTKSRSAIEVVFVSHCVRVFTARFR